MAEVTAIEEQLSHAHYELEHTKQMVYDRENTLAGKEQKISDLKLQADAIIDELKVNKTLVHHIYIHSFIISAGQYIKYHDTAFNIIGNIGFRMYYTCYSGQYFKCAFK